MHRLLLGLNDGRRLVCDHINRDKLDNRLANLRRVTVGQNNQNVVHSGPSGYRGVCYSARPGGTFRWRASVMVDGENHHVGYFIDKLEAVRAVAAARQSLHPFSPEATS